MHQVANGSQRERPASQPQPVPHTCRMWRCKHNGNSTSTAKKVVAEVINVRLRVWLMARFIASALLPCRPPRNVSRIRSKITMVSLME